MTLHSIPRKISETELTAQYAFKTYDTYAFIANYDNIASWKVFTHASDKGNHYAFIQC